MTKRLTILLFIALQATFAQQWSIGMYAPYGNPGCPISDIDMSAVTHIVHWAALVNSDGSLDLTYQRISSDAQPLISTAHASGVKVLLGILNPYFLGQNGNLPNAVANNRGALVGNIMSVVNSYGYDGVDIDWEGSPVDVGALASDLRSQLGSKLLTANAIVTDYRYWGSVQGYFDRVNIMTYDMTGTWEPYTWYNAALYGPDESVWSVDLAVRRYIANGVPASKLGIGIPFYGWQWTGGGVTGPRQTWSSTPSLSQVSYQSLAPSLSPQLYGWDAAAHTSYQTGANGFLTYDDERSVTDKVNYARANNLGGWIIWNLSNDYMPSRSLKHPLLTAVRNAMGGSAAAAPIVSQPAAPPPPAVVQPTQPVVTQPVVTQPVVTQPVVTQPVVTQPVVTQPVVTQPVVTQPAPAPVQVPAISGALAITTTSLPAARVMTSYFQPLASSGAGALNWSIVDGMLPNGLILHPTVGAIIGLPYSAGVFSFTVQLDSSSGSVQKQFTMSVLAQ